MSTLIVGGTSGLGAEIAKRESEYRDVIVTGRHDPNPNFAQYREFDLAKENLSERIGEFVLGLPDIGTLVYSAGFFQKGRISDLDDESIETMTNIGFRALVYFSRELLKKQDELGEIVTITSTSQFTPRELEPVYCAVKAAAGQLTNSLSLDRRVGKARVIAPGGMNTNFWKDSDVDMSGGLDDVWVAEQVMSLRGRDDRYLFAKIPRPNGDTPPQVEIIEARN